MKTFHLVYGVTAAVALGALTTGPVMAQDEAPTAASTGPSEWTTPVRLGNSGLNSEKANESFGIAMNSRGDAVALGFDVTPRVGPDGNAPLFGYREAANVVYRYVGGTWQDPDTIPTPDFIETYVDPNLYELGSSRSALALSDAGHAVIVLGGTGEEDGLCCEESGMFISTSHDITQPDSFTPWRRITPPRGSIPLQQTPSVDVTDSGVVVLGYTVKFAGNEGGCIGQTYASVGKISAGGLAMDPPRVLSSCLPTGTASDWGRSAQVDVSLIGTTATLAYVAGAHTPDPNGDYFLTWVEMATYSTADGAWSDPEQVLPTLKAEPTRSYSSSRWYFEPHVATSSSGTAVIAQRTGFSPTYAKPYVSFNHIRAGASPELRNARSVGNPGESYHAADLVMAEDGRALAAFEVGCDGCTSDYTRRFETLEFTDSTQTSTVLNAQKASLHRQTPRPWIALALPRGAPSLASARIAYTEADLMAMSLGRAFPIMGRIFVAQWPFTDPPREIPGFPGSTTAEYKAPLAPALAVSSSGSALIAFRPDDEKVTAGSWLTYPGNELWVSALDTPNSTGLFPPAHLRAYVDERYDAPLNRMAVRMVRPYFYPEESGDGGYFEGWGWGGPPSLSSRATYEVFIHSGPPGFTVPTEPICANRFNPDGNSYRARRGTSPCVIRESLPSGTYTFTARTLLDGRVSAMSAPTEPLDFIAPPDPPVAPTDVVAVAGDGEVTVRWKAPASDGGSPILGYDVSSSPSRGGCQTEGELTCTITGLTNGTAYTFTVTAWNIAGSSPASTPSAPVTPGKTPTVEPTITIESVARGTGKNRPRVTVKGETTGLAGQTIAVQFRGKGGTWTNANTKPRVVRVAADGRFTASWKRAPAHTFRLIHAATGTTSTTRQVARM
jgi:hypothetical protein